MFFIILAILVTYTVIGMNIERGRFAVRNATYKSFEPQADDYQAAYNDALAKRNKIHHGPHCFTTIDKARYGCTNCTAKNEVEWKKQTNRMKLAEANMTEFKAPKVNYGAALAWPAVLTHDWMRSGKADAPLDYRRIEQLEKSELPELGL